MTTGAWKTCTDHLKAVEGDLTQIAMDKKMWDHVKGLLTTASHIPHCHTVFDWLERQSLTSFIAGIRRHGENAGKGLSYVMQLVKDHAAEITWDRHRSLWSDHPLLEPSAREIFDRFAGEGGNHVDPGIVAAHRTHLLEVSQPVYDFATDNVAHLLTKKDRRRTPDITFETIDEAWGRVEQYFLDYRLLLTGRGGNPLTPTPQFSWERAFSVPWDMEALVKELEINARDRR